MTHTIIGLLFLFAPCILVPLYSSIRRGFLEILTAIIVFQLLLALSTQAFTVFTYPVIFLLNALVAVVSCTAYLIIIYKIKKGDIDSKGGRNDMQKDAANAAIVGASVSARSRFLAYFFPCAAAVIIFCELFSVHHHYTGIVATVHGMDAVVDSSYPYPYYSDEWVGVSFVEYSIQSHGLPFTNPLDANRPFANPLFAFYAFVAELFLLLQLPPLTGWAMFALVNGLFICVLVYAISRIVRASPFAASVAALAVPLIVNATNVPGIWFFVPFIGSFSVFLLAIALALPKEVHTRTIWFSGIAALVALILYPPMIVFIAPAALAFFIKIRHQQKWQRIILIIIGVICGCGVVMGGVLSATFGFATTMHLFVSWIIRPNLDGGIPALGIWNIIPMPLMLLSVAGAVDALRKKTYLFIFPFGAGLVLWCVYAFFPQTIIIDYSRVAAISALLLILPIGLGVDFLTGIMRYAPIYLHIIVIIFFAIVATLYPIGSNWSKLVLVVQTANGTEAFSPDPPITRYLTAVDMQAFNSIHGQYFLSPPWTGLVVGVATHNYPADSKSSTIGNNILSYQSFLRADCALKKSMLSGTKIQWVYSAPFMCPGFQKSEGGQGISTLYKVPK